MTGPSADFAAAIACHRRGETLKAAEFYRRVLGNGIAPEERAAASNLGRIALAAGDGAAAAGYLRASLARDARQADVWRDLGVALLQADDLAEALTALRQALAFDPADADAHCNLALALARSGDEAGARAALAAALAHRPAFAEALNNLGKLDLAQDPGTALARFDAALTARPDFAEAWFNRGGALRALGDIAQASQAFARAAALQPGFAAAHANHGRGLHDLGELDAAGAAYARALALAPGLREALLNRVNLLLESGKLTEAIAAGAAALEQAPQDADISAALLHARQQACDWDGLEKLQAHVLAQARAGEAVPPFVLAAMGAPGALQTGAAARWAAKIAPLRRPRPREGFAAGRIRLGYLSGDFHDHATAHLVAGLFERHDRAAFEVHGYSYGPDDGSAPRKRLAAAFDSLTDMQAWSFSRSADRIRADGIDILIDLKGYTAGARPQIPALRPAPVQVNWLGYPGSMGVDFIDYVIADPVLAPLAIQADCTERILHMPNCFQPNETGRAIGPAGTRAAHGLPESAFVFCCFNNAYKITPAIFAAWMRLLGQASGSVLWLLKANDAAMDNLGRAAGAAGIDPQRLVFAPRLPMPLHLARHRLADLFLDTLPVNALTTASDALYAGLPVLSRLGETVAGRGCGSLLHALGLPELLADSQADYEARALGLARDGTALQGLREKLNAAIATSPLFDGARFARDLETLYRAMKSDFLAARH